MKTRLPQMMLQELGIHYACVPATHYEKKTKFGAGKFFSDVPQNYFFSGLTRNLFSFLI